MRFLYLDPGLVNDVGHHANYCRYIVGELRRRELETVVFGSHAITRELATELGARPHFRISTYRRRDPDAIAGWLIDFDISVRVTFQDLEQIRDLRSTDVVYMSTARPAQLMAIASWLRSIPVDRHPSFVIQLSDPGPVIIGSAGVELLDPDPRHDARPILFRFVGRQLPAVERLYLINFEQAASEVLGLLLGQTVHTLPLPYPSVTNVPKRAPAEPAMISILGHQRVEKGFRHLPETVKALLLSRSDFRLLIQVVGRTGAIDTENELRELAAAEPRLLLEVRPAGKELWQQMLEQSDLILCPYLPQPYVTSFSAVAAEALANGIPIIVPSGTTLERLLNECGGPGLAFKHFESASIVASTKHVLENLHHYKALAHKTAAEWSKRRGPARMTDSMLSLLSS